MKLSASSPLSRFVCLSTSSSILTLSLALMLTTGCSSSGSGSSSGGGGGGQQFSGNTQVTVALTSTANDQLAELNLDFQGITLTSQSGKTVTLLAAQQPSEFIHLNGAIDPLITVTIPQDVYTAATLAIPYGESVCIANGMAEGAGLAFAYYNANLPASSVSVTLPAPITVTGTSMVLALNMVVFSSATVPDCLNPFTGFSLTPTFTLAPLTLSSSSTDAANGKFLGLEGEVASLVSSSNGFNLSLAEGPYGTRTASVSTGSATVFQGISNFPALATRMFVNMDGTLQPDGSIAATRIAVEDPTAVNMFTGPLLNVDSEVPVLMLYGRQEQGPLSPGPNGSGYYFDSPYIDFSNAVFGISGQFTNVQNLPFVASFNASNMVAGQNVDLSSGALSVMGGVYTPGNTITLIPQTLNATVIASSASGSFVDYTVSLASYDLFATLAVQQGQTTLLTNPSQVEVYVDSNTQMLNTQALATGSTFRFYGLVFNDNGTLRMDCAHVNDGVALTPQASSSGRSRVAQTQTTHHASTNGLLPVITTTTIH
ncbi:MAG: DUF5666 domain-containing protein [Candidatus Sulfotelmatobacter sp.]